MGTRRKPTILNPPPHDRTNDSDYARAVPGEGFEQMWKVGAGYSELAFIKRRPFRRMNTTVLHAAIRTEKPQMEPIQTATGEDPNRPYKLCQTARPIVLAGS